MLVVIATGATSCGLASRFSCQQEAPDPKKPAPDSFRVVFETSKGKFDVMARKAWAPIGVDRFYTLVQTKYFDDVRFFRVVKGFVAQFGMSGDPRATQDWQRRCMADEPVQHSNSRGSVSFARGGPGRSLSAMALQLAPSRSSNWPERKAQRNAASPSRPRNRATGMSQTSAITARCR